MCAYGCVCVCVAEMGKAGEPGDLLSGSCGMTDTGGNCGHKISC